MGKKQVFGQIDDVQQKQYEREIRLEYGPTTVNESIQRWNSYSKAQKEIVLEEGNEIYGDLVNAIEAGMQATSTEVQVILQRWHNHIRYFYEPTLDILRGLGEMYNTHPDFHANFTNLHPNLPAYLRDGITQYVDDLEYAEIERMLAEDAEKRLNG